MTETRIDEVAVLLAELPYLDRGELLALAGAQNKDQAARRVAWRAVEDAASRDASRGLESLRDEVAAWATRLGAIVGDEAGSGLADLMLADVRRAAAPTVLDAAAALLYQDDVSASDRAVLLDPWLLGHRRVGGLHPSPRERPEPSPRSPGNQPSTRHSCRTGRGVV